jgi:hypothetical protein
VWSLVDTIATVQHLQEFRKTCARIGRDHSTTRNRQRQLRRPDAERHPRNNQSCNNSRSVIYFLKGAVVSLSPQPPEGKLPLDQTAPSFAPHSSLSDDVNHNIVQSEIEGGVFLEDLPSATVLQIQTQHHDYIAVLLDDGSALISGHPQYCPEPVVVAIAGSTWGGSMLKRRFVGRGMHLEFRHPEYRRPIVTSRIKEIRECARLSHAEIAALA